MTTVPLNDNQQNTEQTKVVCHYCKKPGHVIRECRKRIRKEQEQRNEPSTQKMKPSTSKSYAPCPHCQRTNHPPERVGVVLMPLTDLNGSNRPIKKAIAMTGKTKEIRPIQDLHQFSKTL